MVCFFFGYALDCCFVSPSMGLGRFLGGGKRAQLDFARGVGSRKGRSANRRGGASVFAMDLLLGNLFPFCVCVCWRYLPVRFWSAGDFFGRGAFLLMPTWTSL